MNTINWIQRLELACRARAYSCHLTELIHPAGTWRVEVTEPDWVRADHWRRWMRENRGT